MKKGFLNATSNAETKLSKVEEATPKTTSNAEPTDVREKEVQNAPEAPSSPGQNNAGSPQQKQAIVRVKITQVAPKDAPSRIPTTPPPPPPPPTAPGKPVVAILGEDSASFTWSASEHDSMAEKGKGEDERNNAEEEGKEPTGGRVEGGEEEVPAARTFQYNLVVESQGGNVKAITMQGEWDETLLDGKGGYSAVVKDLEHGMEYCAHVEVVCKIHGAVKGEMEKLSLPPTCPLTPAPPSVSGKGKTWIKLRWTAPNGRGEAITGYKVEMGEVGRTDGTEGPNEQAQNIVVVYAGPETKCEIKGLRPGVMYRTRVLAGNAVGESGYSDFTSVPTASTVPAAPNQPFVAQVGLEWMLVSWIPPHDDGGAVVDTYHLEVHDGSQDGFMVKYVGAETQYLLKAVVPGHKYGLRIKAGNANGFSPFSPVLEATGVCGPPSAPGQIRQAGPSSPFSLKITWAPPSSENGSPVQLYQVAMRRVMDGMPVGFFEVVYNGPDNACEVQNLYPASLYEFGVVAISALGSGAPSQCSALSTSAAAPNPPPPPFLMGCEAGALHVGWTLPDLCNGAPVLSFRLEAIAPDGGATLLYEGSSLSYSVQNLAPGVTTMMRVAATNSLGTGPPSVPACFTTPCVAPSPPQAVAAAGSGKGVAQVWWEAPSSEGGSAVVSYRVQLTRKEGPGQDTLVATVPSAPATFEGLPLGAAYKVQAMAMNAQGWSSWSEPTTLLTDPAPPGAPEPPVVGEVLSDGVLLSWTPPACHKNAPVEQFTLQMHDGNAYSTIYTGSLLSFHVGGLEPGSHYKFRLRAANCKGEGPYSSLVAATTQPVVPGPPLAVTLVSVSGAGVRLKWAPPAFQGGSSAHAYSVLMQEVGEGGGGEGKAKRKQGGGGGASELAEVWTGPATSCKVKASPETDYAIFVVAHNQVGEGAPSAALRVTTPALAAAAPVAPRAPSSMAAPHLLVKGHAVSASWIAPKDALPPARLFHLEVTDAEGKVVESYSGPATAREVQGLTPGSGYAFRVAATNDVGQGPWSAAAHASIKAAVEKRSKAPPPAPTQIELERATKTSLKLRWTPGAGPEQAGGCSFKLEVAEGSGSYELAYTGTDCECTVMKLKPAQRYRVRVHAFNKAGASKHCEEEQLRTQAPAPPSWHRTLGCIFTALIFCIIMYWLLFLE